MIVANMVRNYLSFRDYSMERGLERNYFGEEWKLNYLLEVKK